MASSSANNEKSSFLDREKRHKVKISCLKSLKKWWCWILIIIVLVCCIAIPMIMMLLGKTLKCPLFHSNYWICPDGSKVNIPDALMSTHHVNQSYLVKQIEAACRPTFPDFCERKNQTFLQIFREGDCSGGLAGDMADGPFLAACKTHDVCYTLQRGQQACDEEFCSNLKNSCNWTLRLVELFQMEY